MLRLKTLVSALFLLLFNQAMFSLACILPFKYPAVLPEITVRYVTEVLANFGGQINLRIKATLEFVFCSQTIVFLYLFC